MEHLHFYENILLGFIFLGPIVLFMVIIITPIAMIKEHNQWLNDKPKRDFKRMQDATIKAAMEKEIQEQYEYVRERTRQKPGSGSQQTDENPYQVLGIKQGANKTEIKLAYHAKLKANHPDKVAYMSLEIQELAHKQTLRIKKAYEKLIKI